MRAALPFLLLSVPLVEIALFVIVGDVIGLWGTLAATVVAAVVGLAMIRSQGVAAVQRLRPGAVSGEAIPLATVVRGAAIVMAGMLLLVPGFLTDILGLSLLLPPVRHRLGEAIRRRVQPAGSSSAGYGAGFAGGPIIDSEAVVVPDDPPARDGSGRPGLNAPRRPEDTRPEDTP